MTRILHSGRCLALFRDGRLILQVLAAEAERFCLPPCQTESLCYACPT
jgi:hypothetical protein